MLRKGNILFLVFSYILFQSCEKAKPILPNEEELITELEFVLVSKETGEKVIFSFIDNDGEGGEEPVIKTGALIPKAEYSGELHLYSGLKEITEEIEEEGTEHQFYFIVADSLNLSVKENDLDENGDPIGLKSEIETGLKSKGDLIIILRHQPVKGLAVEEAGGETDIQVNFTIEIE